MTRPPVVEGGSTRSAWADEGAAPAGANRDKRVGVAGDEGLGLGEVSAPSAEAALAVGVSRIASAARGGVEGDTKDDDEGAERKESMADVSARDI